MNKQTILTCVLLSCVILFSSVSSVFAVWEYSQGPTFNTGFDNSIDMGNFAYTPDDMPQGEVSLLQRLQDILNNKYTTDKITNSRDYLLNETIQVYWGGDKTADPYVGSMDLTFAEQIGELFRDVIIENGVSFLLKNEDLNNDGYNEIAMYSTSDPLDCRWDYDGTVCVFVSVFTPKLDENRNVIGYTLVCESLRGFCSQVFYDYESWLPSFTTESWANGVGFYYHTGIVPIEYPDDHDYSKYNRIYYPPYDQWWSNGTLPFGQTLSECLYNKIPDLSLTAQ